MLNHSTAMNRYTLGVGLVLAWCAVGLAQGTRNWFWEYPLQNCRMHKLLVRPAAENQNGTTQEVCAISAPPSGKDATAPKRIFTITVRDPSRLDDAKDRNARQHVLLAQLPVPARAGEYLHYEMVSPLPLDGQRHLLLLPLLNGVPDDYRGGRLLLFIYDAGTRTFTPAFETTLPLEAKSPSVQLRSKKNDAVKTVMLVYQQDGSQQSIPLVWQGRDVLARAP